MQKKLIDSVHAKEFEPEVYSRTLVRKRFYSCEEENLAQTRLQDPTRGCP